MKKRLMAITFAALMATSMMGSTVFAATDGGSVAGKTSLADADFDTDYQPQKDEYKIYCTYKNIHSWYDAIKTGVDAAVADLKDKGVTIDYEWYGPAQPDAVDQVNSIETAVGQGYESHEQRLQAFKDVIATYPDIEVVDEQRDDDSVEKAISLTESWLQAYPDLGGILCNNMSNPVGACQAVTDAGKAGDIIIGGMDHDLRTLNYLKDGTLYVAQVQNCYDMGYKLIWNAVKTIDGETVDEVTDVGSTSVYADDADNYITMLYGEDADTDAE